MMTKLTLSIDKEVIEKAKEISRRKGKSLSRMVEEHLQRLTDIEQAKPSYVKTMSGSLKNKVDHQLNLKDAKGKFLKAKYGV